MKKLTSLLVIILWHTNPAFGAELLKIVRATNTDSVQVYFTFDKAPKPTVRTDNKRIDLVFPDTSQSSALTLFEADHNIVKILTRQEGKDLLFILFFRYKPQQYKITPSDTNTVVLDLLLGNQYSSAYTKLADQLKGLTVLDRKTIDMTNPYHQCPYARNWTSFFDLYESPVHVEVKMKYTLPPFPIIALLPPGESKNLSLLDPKMYDEADLNRWDDLGLSILEQIKKTQDEEKQKLLALTYGETLVRGEDFVGAFKQLYLLQEKYPDERIGTYAEFLLTYLRATKQDVFLAAAEFDSLASNISNNSPLAPYLYLARIDSSLATKNYKELNTLLQQNDIALPEEIAQIKALREADYWLAINQPVKAYAIYRLLDNSAVIDELPYSLHNYCETRYVEKQFKEAVQCYYKLAGKVSDQNSLGLISFRTNMARLKIARANSTLMDAFGQIENSYPNSEAGERAAMKRADLLFLQDQTRAKTLLETYDTIATNAISRSVREEAIFKSCLLNHFVGKNDRSIEQLKKFLRDFHSGDVIIPAQALLIDILPGEIKRLVAAKEYVQALVLARQNREYFEKNWIDSTFLIDIADAYHQIGLFDEAHKLYLYLLEITPIDKREQFYLPMIKAVYDYGNYSLVDDYAAQYNYNYPKGTYVADVLSFRIQALMDLNKLREAELLLPETLPKGQRLDRLVALLFFRLGNYQKCADLLQAIQPKEQKLTEEETFMLGESLFQTNHFEQAKVEFLRIPEKSQFYDEVLFRLAEIERKAGNTKNALSLFTKIVEKGKSPQWKGYAERELQIEKANEATKKLF